ncbi:MAG: ATP-binding protein [Capsulimonadales bacterium]|nr:ATP-binding protein [Capsulimonadales bacterium]
MATLLLICGLPGAGKTTLARRLERERPALRLCPDEWILAILRDPNDVTERDRLRSPVEAVQWELAKNALMLGNDVILEWGFWSRAERRQFRDEAVAIGAKTELYYLEVEKAELWRRLTDRNARRPPGTFPVAEAEFELWHSWFEPPGNEEQPVRIANR